MTKLHRKTTDQRLYAAAGDPFTSAGGSPWSVQSERDRQMAEFSVGYDGPRYRYNGYRYDRWEDAVAYARLMRSRPGHLDTAGPFPPGRRSPPTTDAEHELMASLGIRADEGAYRFEGFRYDALPDAVNYAKRAPRRQTEDDS
ncbi:hypothetical protein [Piscinibacter sp. XHJ-5]|uniref:hypothetical protein n=1 Tax=Piscinibacter sp. XHJ-5 TaxID=3037797 RepID=UPI002452B945|nr:hypothetical protein [Piscinibacter sp. XHJ-5]